MIRPCSVCMFWQVLVMMVSLADRVLARLVSRDPTAFARES